MTRRLVWLSLFIAALTLLLGLWFITHFEQVPYQRWEDPGIEARRNPYLAFERFLQRMGRPLQQDRDAGLFDALPPRGVLILDAGRGRHMTPARIEALLHWVEQGGYLLLAPETPGSVDPLLQRLGVRWQDKPGEGNSAKTNTPRPDEAADADTDTHAPAAAPLTEKQREAGTSVVVPGHAALRLEVDTRPLRSRQPPLWRTTGPRDGDQVLHFARGAGHITVISNLGMILRNYAIGRHDHAELLWTLLDTYQPAGAIHLLQRLAAPGLLEWLLLHAWPALLASALLLGLWLWRVIPRFGVIAASPPAERRALGEHLAAIGRYVWRAGGLAHWTTLTRRHFQQRLALHHPAIAVLPLAAQAEALARLLGANPHGRREIEHALLGAVLTPLDFTHAQRTLRDLEHSLRTK